LYFAVIVISVIRQLYFEVEMVLLKEFYFQLL